MSCAREMRWVTVGTSSFIDWNMLGSTAPSHNDRLLPKDLQ
jgi:hypothetical protein